MNKIHKYCQYLLIAVLITIIAIGSFKQRTNNLNIENKYKYNYRIDLYQPNDTFIYYYTNNINFYYVDSIHQNINCIKFIIENIDTNTYLYQNYNNLDKLKEEIGDTVEYCTEYRIINLK